MSVGGCNGCKADVNVLGTAGWDLGRFGIPMVASLRGTVGLVITGAVLKSMEPARKNTYDAVPAHKIVRDQASCIIF